MNTCLQKYMVRLGVALTLFYFMPLDIIASGGRHPDPSHHEPGVAGASSSRAVPAVDESPEVNPASASRSGLPRGSDMAQQAIDILYRILAYQAFDPYLLEGIEDSGYTGEGRALPDFSKTEAILEQNTAYQLGNFYFYHRSPRDRASYNSVRMGVFKELIYIPFCQALQKIAGLTYEYHELTVLGMFSEKKVEPEYVLSFFQDFFQTKEIGGLRKIMKKVRKVAVLKESLEESQKAVQRDFQRSLRQRGVSLQESHDLVQAVSTEHPQVERIKTEIKTFYKDIPTILEMGHVFYMGDIAKRLYKIDKDFPQAGEHFAQRLSMLDKLMQIGEMLKYTPKQIKNKKIIQALTNLRDKNLSHNIPDSLVEILERGAQFTFEVNVKYKEDGKSKTRQKEHFLDFNILPDFVRTLKEWLRANLEGTMEVLQLEKEQALALEKRGEGSRLGDLAMLSPEEYKELLNLDSEEYIGLANFEDFREDITRYKQDIDALQAFLGQNASQNKETPKTKIQKLFAMLTRHINHKFRTTQQQYIFNMLPWGFIRDPLSALCDKTSELYSFQDPPVLSQRLDKLLQLDIGGPRCDYKRRDALLSLWEDFILEGCPLENTEDIMRYIEQRIQEFPEYLRDRLFSPAGAQEDEETNKSEGEEVAGSSSNSEKSLAARRRLLVLGRLKEVPEDMSKTPQQHFDSFAWHLMTDFQWTQGDEMRAQLWEKQKSLVTKKTYFLNRHIIPDPTNKLIRSVVVHDFALDQCCKKLSMDFSRLSEENFAAVRFLSYAIVEMLSPSEKPNKKDAEAKDILNCLEFQDQRAIRKLRNYWAHRKPGVPFPQFMIPYYREHKENYHSLDTGLLKIRTGISMHWSLPSGREHGLDEKTISFLPEAQAMAALFYALQDRIIPALHEQGVGALRPEEQEESNGASSSSGAGASSSSAFQ